jgi:hypothetical protein
MNEEQILEEEFVERLNRIAYRLYGKHYFELCESRQRTVMTLYYSGDF